MKVRLIGYFKFKPLAFETVNVNDSDISDALVKHAAGMEVAFDKTARRNAWNAVVGKCAQLGWYKNGGWRPRGSRHFKAESKDRGDVLGVCAYFHTYDAECQTWPCAWLYCDSDFRKALLEDFSQPETRMKVEVMYPFHNSIPALLDMQNARQKWFDGFCERVHDPDKFAMRMFGRTFTADEAAAMAAAERNLRTRGYIRRMLLKKTGKED